MKDDGVLMDLSLFFFFFSLVGLVRFGRRGGGGGGGFTRVEEHRYDVVFTPLNGMEYDMETKEKNKKKSQREREREREDIVASWAFWACICIHK